MEVTKEKIQKPKNNLPQINIMHNIIQQRKKIEKKKDNKKLLYWAIGITILFVLILASSMIGITVLDPQSLNNVTININITT